MSTDRLKRESMSIEEATMGANREGHGSLAGREAYCRREGIKPQGGAWGNGWVYQRLVAEEFNRRSWEQARHAPRNVKVRDSILILSETMLLGGSVEREAKQAAFAPTKRTHSPR